MPPISRCHPVSLVPVGGGITADARDFLRCPSPFALRAVAPSLLRRDLRRGAHMEIDGRGSSCTVT